MINVAHIMPTSYLSELNAIGANDGIGMALAHLVLTDNRYKLLNDKRNTFYSFVILDNSAFELGEAIDDGNFITAINLIEPDEIVLPDVLFDATETMNRIRKFLVKHKDYVAGLSLMAVPHGQTLDEYIKSYVEISRIEQVSTLGIGTVYNERFKSGGKLGREVIFETLRTRGLLASKQHHLLGLGDDGNLELSKLAKFDFIRSCDSSAAYINARNGVLITDSGYKKDRQKVEFADVYDNKVFKLLCKNILELNKKASWRG